MSGSITYKMVLTGLSTTQAVYSFDDVGGTKKAVAYALPLEDWIAMDRPGELWVQAVKPDGSFSEVPASPHTDPEEYF